MKIRTEKQSHSNEHLTIAEMGKLWASYVGNTMGKCVLQFFLKHIEDKDIKKILEHSLELSETFIQDIKKIFIKENFPIPMGFSDEDVNLKAPRLFADEFYLHYLKYTGKAGVSIYSAAIPLVTRKDVSDFFYHALDLTAKLMMDVNKVMMEKGFLTNAPILPAPKKIQIVDSQRFLKGYLGNVRPLHGLEVAHLFGNINNDVTSKALIVGFCQVAQNEKVKKYLERGKQINHKHIDILSNKLIRENVPAPTLLDHLVTSSTTPPFSDKLMLFHKIDMFSMKIREYANGASLNGRRDIGAMYAKCLLDVSMYVEDGAQIMIEKGWMEQPPEVIDRDNVSTNE